MATITSSNLTQIPCVAVVPNALSPDEQLLIDSLFPKEGEQVSISRKSSRAFDIAVSTPTMSAWLPLLAIRTRVAWNSKPVAKMTDYPEMAMEGDWSGVRDSSTEAIWKIFDTFVLSNSKAE